METTGRKKNCETREIPKTPNGFLKRIQTSEWFASVPERIGFSCRQNEQNEKILKRRGSRNDRKTLTEKNYQLEKRNRQKQHRTKEEISEVQALSKL